MINIDKEIIQIWNKIKEYKRVTICTHVDPDGDTIGTAVALKEIILSNIRNIEVKISGDKYPRYLSFLDGNDIVEDSYFNESLKIVVDTSTKSRIWDKRVITCESIKIDHHKNEEKWLIAIGGDHWPATGQIIWKMINLLNLKVNQKVYDSIFVSVWTDTEGLTQRNISKVTFDVIDSIKIDKLNLLKKMELSKNELIHIKTLEGKMIIKDNIASLVTNDYVSNDYLRQMTGMLSNKKGFEVYIGITKAKDNTFRGELRSKGKVDVSKIAESFGGGGHFSSSGFKTEDYISALDVVKTLRTNYNFK